MSEEAGGEATAAAAPPAAKPKRGFLSRIWNAVFRGRGDDYEKKLQYLSKEEASVHARMKRRAHRWRKSARNIILFSVSLEVAAIAYAVLATRMPDLTWQRRAICVLPMFALPALSFSIYYILGSLTRMLDRKDQKTLERLRTERQAKIDELKERTNFYATQQLIQRYDLDPAAKAAAAAILASKLGAETGLKVFIGEESKVGPSPAAQRDPEVAEPDGLRNRKRPHRRTQSAGSNDLAQKPGGGEMLMSAPVLPQPPVTVEHYDQNTGSDGGGWIARIAAMLVGEDPTQSFALICGNCRRHNGLAKKEDFPYITYFCPHCHALNGPKRDDANGPELDSAVLAPAISADSVVERESRSELSAVGEEITDDGNGESEEQAK